MTEHLTAYVPESLTHADATLHLGTRAAELACSVGPVEQVDNTRRVATMGDVDDGSDNEGSRNAKRFKEAYDAAIESINAVLQDDDTELDDRLAALLASIDVLNGTPYISSVPEFVDCVGAARTAVEQVRSHIASGGGLETNLTITSALSRVRQQLAATTVAYQP